MDPLSASSTAPGALPVSAVGPAAPARAAVETLAEEFEAMFLLQILRQMRHSFLDEQDPGEGFGAGTMTDTFDEEFAREMSRSGGAGIARVLLQHLPGGTLPSVTSPASGALVGAATPAAPPAPAAAPGGEASDATLPVVPLDGPVTSTFGWRADPFVGTPRFHRGIDLKAAYGREVPAAASGRVAFAGEQGGYGQTVVIEHANGFTTRYAHLSAVTVSAGQQLANGDVVGRVGQSGRATGPHLHFEVTRDGQQLDPATFSRLTPDGLKELGRGVDFPFDAASQTVVSIGADHEG